MSAPMTTTSLRRPDPPPGLRPLLSSFPTPPTHIPASPVVSSPSCAFLTPLPPPRSPLSLDHPPPNPPPSGPPSAPLPPLPAAPSPVTPAEQIAFFAMRRTSYASTSSLPSPPSSHRSRSSSLSNSENDHPDTPTSRGRARLHDPDRDGASSPDITILIQRTHTPNPHSGRVPTRSLHSRRRTSSASTSADPGSRLKRLKSTPALGASATQTGFYPSSRPDAVPFPPPLSRAQDREPEPEEDWDREDPWEVWDDPEEQLIADDSEEDVIDLRTPLPHLMLRAGLLSPHSRLLPRPSPSPEPEPHRLSRSASQSTFASVSGRSSPAGSTYTATSLSGKKHPRDERDTEKRRQRHKDGRLLRGGVGLTTGLGWSDSEDEDAPSELTDRLSRLAPTLSRKSSMASSVASSQYARSPSRTTTFSSSGGGSFSPSTSSTDSRGSVATASMPFTTLSRSTSASTAASATHERRDAPSVLPYLAPPQEQEEKGHRAGLAHVQELTLDVDMPVPEYPYSFSPPSPTEPGHSLLGHGDESLQVSGGMGWKPPRSPLFDAVDPFAKQYRPPAQGQERERHAHVPTDDDRSPTPTNSNTSGTASTASLPMPGTPRAGDDDGLGGGGPPSAWGSGVGGTHEEGGAHARYRVIPGRALPVRKSSMPAMLKREEGEGEPVPPVPGSMRVPRSGGVGARPVSKALPPLPADLSRGPSFSSIGSATQVQQARMSGIPKTASMSSLRSIASRQAAAAISAPSSTSVSPLSQSTSHALRERAVSSASTQSVRSIRSISSNASAGSTTRARPSLPTPKAAAPPSTMPTSTSSSSFAASATSSTAVSLPPRARTASTSSTASGRPLKSAIKPSAYRSYPQGAGVGAVRYAGSGMVVPKSRFAGGAQTGIAI